MSESNVKENNKINNENNINEEEKEEDEDIDTTNNIMKELTFGHSNSSFKVPQVNTINFDTNSNKKETESDINEINDEFKNIQAINNNINNPGENSLDNDSNNMNNNRIITISSTNKDEKNSYNNVNPSLKDLFRINKNVKEKISIHSIKNDLASNDSNNIYRNDNPINPSLSKLIYGNKNKNDIISLNSNYTQNETESVNQSLLNLVTNKNEKNDIISLNSNDLRSNKGNLNLQEMLNDFERKTRMTKIDKKIAKSGFIHIYDDNKPNKENKHFTIIDESDENDAEKLFIYQNDGINNHYQNLNFPQKKVIDETKYYEILLHNNKNINKKVHYSTLFPKRKNKKK